MRQALEETGTSIEPDLATLALLSRIVAVSDAESETPQRRDLLDQTLSSVLTAFPDLEPTERAWILSVLPLHDTFEPLLNMARKSEHRHVKMAYLLFQLTGPDDPMLDAAMLDSLPCGDISDMNRDCVLDSLDAALVLQVAASLIPPPEYQPC